MRAVFFTFLLLPTLLAAAPSSESDELERLVTRLDAIRDRYEVPAFALTLVENDMTRTRAMGMADIAAKRSVTANTRFRIGSISKAFAGIALLMAEANGDLDLDDPVGRILPDPPFRNPWHATHPITVAGLLEHSAGFQDWVKDEWDLNDPLRLDTALAFRPESRVARWPPGLHSSYSNSGPGVAAWVLEQASGEEYEAFVKARIFAPLGMTTAVFQADETTLRLLATGYDSDARTPIPYWHVILRPSAAISLNPRDMGPVIRLLINRGVIGDDRLVTEAMVHRLEHPQTTIAARAGLDYGYGLGIYQSQRDGHSLFGHGGDGDGYLAHFAYSLESKRGYFLVINSFTHEPLRRMRAVVEDYILRGLPGPSYPSYEPMPRELARLAGTYHLQTARFAAVDDSQWIKVGVTGNRLVTTLPGGKSRDLVPVGSGLFRRPDQSVATTVFAAEDGRLFLQGPMGNYARDLP
jgi:CubicO group peptidase (beta-lactamase class C family)